MKKLTLTIFIILFTCGLQTSCFLFCGGGSGVDTKLFTINDLSISTTNSNGDIIDSSATYGFDKVFKQIEILDYEYITNSSNNWILINAAYACSPIPPTAIQRLENIEIVALNDFTFNSNTDSIRVGQDISNLFVIGRYYSTMFSSLDEFIQNDPEIYENESFSLRLANRPHQKTMMTFKVSVIMTEGLSFTFDNEVLNIE